MWRLLDSPTYKDILSQQFFYSGILCPIGIISWIYYPNEITKVTFFIMSTIPFTFYIYNTLNSQPYTCHLALCLDSCNFFRAEFPPSSLSLPNQYLSLSLGNVYLKTFNSFPISFKANLKCSLLRSYETTTTVSWLFFLYQFYIFQSFLVYSSPSYSFHSPSHSYSTFTFSHKFFFHEQKVFFSLRSNFWKCVTYEHSFFRFDFDPLLSLLKINFE